MSGAWGKRWGPAELRLARARQAGRDEALEGVKQPEDSPAVRALWSDLQGLGFQREYEFDIVRRWRVDFVHLDLQLAVEVEGGTFLIGRHQRPAGYANDIEKYNALVMQDYWLLRFTSEMVLGDQALPVILQAMRLRSNPKPSGGKAQ